jgi:RimJ/RimL family protein N-acetyltransferase
MKSSTCPGATPDAISIRPYQVDDASALYEAAVESVRDVRPFMPWCRPGLTVEEARRWIKSQISAFEARIAFDFVILSADRRFLGGCGLNQIDNVNRRANLGYWVRSSATRQGVATTAIRQLVQWAFTNTDLVRLELVVSTQNVASLRAAQKSGAAREGILKKRLLLHGTAHDAVMLSFVRGGESPG